MPQRVYRTGQFQSDCFVVQFLNVRGVLVRQSPGIIYIMRI